MVNSAKIEIEIVSSILKFLVELLNAHRVFGIEVFAFALLVDEGKFALFVDQFGAGLEGFVFEFVDRFETLFDLSLEFSHFLLFLFGFAFQSFVFGFQVFDFGVEICVLCELSPIVALLILLYFELQELELLSDLFLAQHSFPKFFQIIVSFLHTFLQFLVQILAQFVQFVPLLHQGLVVRIIWLFFLVLVQVRQLAKLFLQKLYIFLVFACFFLLQTQQFAQALFFLGLDDVLSWHFGVQTGLAWVLPFLGLFHLSAHHQFSFDGGFGIQRFVEFVDLAALQFLREGIGNFNGGYAYNLLLFRIVTVSFLAIEHHHQDLQLRQSH